MKANNEITVKKVVKKNKKYIVNFDNELELSVTEDEIIEFRIIKDKIFTAIEIEKIKSSCNLSTYFNKTLNYINFKPRTRKEVEDYLLKHELTEDQIEQIITRLIDIDFINDIRYVKSFINECSRKAKGKGYIIQTLTSKGIDKNQVLEYLYLYEDFQEEENAYNLAIKCSKSLTKYPVKRQQLQLTNKLIQSGFSYDIVNKVISRIELVDESYDTLIKDYNKLKLKDYSKNEIIQKLLAKGYNYSSIKEVVNK